MNIRLKNNFWEASGVYDIIRGKTQRQLNEEFSNLNETIRSEVIPNRLKNKKIAIYGDSWSTETYGKLGADYIETITQREVHVVAQGSITLAQIYTNCWDSYNADIYIIEGGLNDASLSTKGDAFVNTIKQWVTAIKNINSNAEIYFVTPPLIRTNAQYNNMFPIEFYRVSIWRMAAIVGYNVINALKWTDVKLRNDRVHPEAASVDLIGKHIVTALENYGDEETHVTEFSLLGRENNQLLIKIINGQPYIVTQNFDQTASEANNVYVDISNLGTTFSTTQLPIFNNASGSTGALMYNLSTPGRLRMFFMDLQIGGRVYLNSVAMPVDVQSWILPSNF